MEWTGLLVVAVVIATGIVLVSRRWRGDRPEDRGPYSTAISARGSFAAFQKTLEPPAEAEEDREGSGDADRPGH